MNTPAEPREPRTEAGQRLVARDLHDYDDRAISKDQVLQWVLAIEDEADEARQRVVDAALLARALDNLWEARWGPLPMPKGQTTINLENAEAIAIECERLDALGEPGGMK